MTQTTTVEVSRNLSKVDEMCMDTEEYSLRAEIDSAGTVVRNINNGSVSDKASGSYLGSFSASGPGTLNVNFQSVTSRDKRRAIFEAVEDFVEGATANVAGETTAM